MLSLYAHIFARITPPPVIRSGVSTATLSAYMASFSWSTSLFLLPFAQPLVWRCLLRDRRHTKGWPAAHFIFRAFNAVMPFLRLSPTPRELGGLRR
jgi:hypothetical protein